MRGHQLRDIVAPVTRDLGFSATVESDFASISEALVVMHKTFILEASEATIADLGGARNMIVMDPIDMALDDRKLAHADALIASSQAQRNHLIDKYSPRKIFYLPHHVDARIVGSRCQSERFACAYIGDPDNGLHARQLRDEGYCDVVAARDPRRSDWIDLLGQYNCHYIVRNRRPWDGMKPFIKGFTAAHCGAVVIAGKNDREAGLVLGPAYPFVYDIASVAQARDAIEDARTSFRGDRWRLAEAIMEDLAWSSSLERVKFEFRRIMRFALAHGGTGAAADLVREREGVHEN